MATTTEEISHGKIDKKMLEMSPEELFVALVDSIETPETKKMMLSIDRPFLLPSNWIYKGKLVTFVFDPVRKIAIAARNSKGETQRTVAHFIDMLEKDLVFDFIDDMIEVVKRAEQKMAEKMAAESPSKFTN